MVYPKRPLVAPYAAVADLEAAVTDTHALIFYAAGSARLGSRARRLFERADSRGALIYVPAVVVWELTVLANRGRVNLRRSVRDFVDTLFSNPSYQPHALEVSQVLVASELTSLRDPLDALISAAALDLGLPLISRDAAITESRQVKTVW